MGSSQERIVELVTVLRIRYPELSHKQDTYNCPPSSLRLRDHLRIGSGKNVRTAG